MFVCGPVVNIMVDGRTDHAYVPLS